MTLPKKFFQDITQDVPVRQCGTIVFNADNLSNVVSVELYEDGEPVTLGGSAVGAVIRADGLTVPLTGSISGNTASVTLTAECFAVPGQISVGIQIIVGDVKTTVLKAIYNVDVIDTGSIPAGGETAASVADLVQEIQTAVASIPADYSALSADVQGLKNDISPSTALLKNILVPDFAEITVANRKIYKQGSSIYIKITGTNGLGIMVSVSGDEVRGVEATPSVYQPNIGNLLPMSMYNPLMMAVFNKPSASVNACRLAVYFYTVENDVITRLSDGSISFDLDANVNQLRKAGALSSNVLQNATHFELVLYIRTAQGLPTDSYTRIMLDLAPASEVAAV